MSESRNVHKAHEGMTKRCGRAAPLHRSRRVPPPELPITPTRACPRRRGREVVDGAVHVVDALAEQRASEHQRAHRRVVAVVVKAAPLLQPLAALAERPLLEAQRRDAAAQAAEREVAVALDGIALRSSSRRPTEWCMPLVWPCRQIMKR